MANFTGNPNQIDADRLDHWMVGLFGAGIAMSPISRVAMGILLLPAVLILLYRFFKTENVHQILAYRKTLIGSILLALFSWFTLTSFFSLDVAKSLQVTIRTFAMIVIAVILFRYCVSRRGLALNGLKIGFIMFVCWSLVGSFFIYFNEPLFKYIFNSFGAHANLVFYKNDGSLAIVYIAMAVYFGLASQGRMRWVYLACYVLLMLFVYANGHHAASNKSAIAGNIIGLLGGITLLGLTYLPTMWRRVSVLGIFLLALVGTTVVMEKLAPITEIGDVPKPALSYPDHHRQVIWSFVYDKFQEDPLLGVGIDAISKTEHANTKLIYFKGQEYVPAHPHNWVLEIAVETGMMGIILVLSAMALFVIYLLDLFRQQNTDKKMIFTLFYFFCSFWVISMAAFSIWSAWWLISFFMTTAMMMAVIKEKASD